MTPDSRVTKCVSPAPSENPSGAPGDTSSTNDGRFQRSYSSSSMLEARARHLAELQIVG